MSLRVSLVEDHPVLRDVLQEYIGQLPGVELCVVSANAEDALDEFEGSMPDVMLIDLSLPRMSGIDLIRELHLRQPELRCAILSGHRAPDFVRQALGVGAHGYLLKGDPMEIDRGLQAFVAGKRYFSRELKDS
ncbi:MAG: response regulator transcription factor [Pseudomonadota bacterium]|nr:response regulator transcription factor [Pseudomonadota bacterium]